MLKVMLGPALYHIMKRKYDGQREPPVAAFLVAVQLGTWLVAAVTLCATVPSPKKRLKLCTGWGVPWK